MKIFLGKNLVISRGIFEKKNTARPSFVIQSYQDEIEPNHRQNKSIHHNNPNVQALYARPKKRKNAGYKIISFLHERVS